MLHLEGVVLDIGASVLDVLAHERGEELIGVRGGVPHDPQQGAALGVHGGLPQFLGVHLTEALEALHLDAPAADVVQRRQDAGNVGHIDHQRLLGPRLDEPCVARRQLLAGHRLLLYQPVVADLDAVLGEPLDELLELVVLV